MTLRLRIVSDHRRLLGDRSSIAFTVDGGTIGRSADNDWVLPDPLRYVSAHHARVEYRDGHFYLEDLSTNGVFVNDDDRPLAKALPTGHLLKTGDIVRMGDYQIVAAVETEGEQTAASDSGAGPVPTSIHGLRTLGRANAQTDIGAMLNLDDLLVPESTPHSTFHPVNAYGQANTQIPAPARAVAPAQASIPVAMPAPTPSAEEEAIERRIARLAKAAGRDPKNGLSAPALYDVHSGLQAFCRGAGVEVERLPPDAQTRLLHLAGQLFREALVGLKDLDRSRNDTRNRFRIELPADPDDPRPSLARSTVEDLVIDLFAQHESRRLDAVGWLREAIAEGKTHEIAAAKATRAAFVEFLDRLDPAELEARFERAARRGKARSADKAQYWELFTTFYRNLIEMPADHLPHTFVEAFAAAYKEYVKKPLP
ncbi:MAG TPA: type VI secretion system-associated FHA domain protein TagH [Steroidobacteraceae bacterium]|nr:type VI secretion system-associated FHA domain protein TagH [Steroidobacteraceae bacterium]